MINTLEIYQLGSKSYYDEVPFYKNPYHDDVLCSACWDAGWEKAQEEHILFTENQSLKAENKELSIDNVTSQCDIVELKSSLDSAEIQLILLRDRVFQFETQRVEISTLLDTVYSYSTDSSIFSFRREKLIQYLKQLRVSILS